MVEDYRHIIKSHLPALAKLYNTDAEAIHKQGLEVLADCESVKGFNTFHAVIGQKVVGQQGQFR